MIIDFIITKNQEHHDNDSNWNFIDYHRQYDHHDNHNNNDNDDHDQ